MFFTSDFWITFIIFFALFGKSLWFIYYFGLYAYDKDKRYDNPIGKISLIIPTFNEDSKLLKNTIDGVKNVIGVDKIVFINDGSTNPNVIKTLNENNYDNSYTVVNMKQNRGKRHAQLNGILKEYDSEIYVLMDSDTILERHSIMELIRPLSDPKIGGTTACINVANKNENFLTKCISAMYWTASHIWRQAPSNYGFVQVTNGQLSAYKGDLIRKLMPEYITQKFMKVYCTLSDDRWLTHQIQTKFQKQIKYIPTSIAHTYIPNTIKGAYKMFLRWKRGSLRESILVTKKFTKHPLLVCDVWANHLIALMQLFVRISIIIIAFFYPMILLYYLIIISIISLFFAFHMIIYNIKEVPYRICYSIINEILFSWVFVHAWLTIHKQGSWQTRD